MHREGHYGASLAAYAPVALGVAAVEGVFPALVGAGAAVAFSMVPDVDLRVPGLPHRGPTHTVAFGVCVSGAVGLVAVPLSPRIAAFAASVVLLSHLSHIAADAVTPAGVHPLEPFSDRRYDGEIAASNPLANGALLLVGLVLVLVAVGVGVRL